MKKEQIRTSTNISEWRKVDTNPFWQRKMCLGFLSVQVPKLNYNSLYPIVFIYIFCHDVLHRPVGATHGGEWGHLSSGVHKHIWFLVDVFIAFEILTNKTRCYSPLIFPRKKVLLLLFLTTLYQKKKKILLFFSLLFSN